LDALARRTLPVLLLLLYCHLGGLGGGLLCGSQRTPVGVLVGASVSILIGPSVCVGVALRFEALVEYDVSYLALANLGRDVEVR
jgi:hypothetical protein